MPVIARRKQSLDTLRQQLEADLLQSGWREVYPKWLERDAKMFEKEGLLGGRRIMTDEIGVFLYKFWGQQAGKPFWKLHRGVVGYDRGVIMDTFEKRGHDE